MKKYCNMKKIYLVIIFLFAFILLSCDEFIESAQIIKIETSGYLTEQRDYNMYHPIKVFDNNPKSAWLEDKGEQTRRLCAGWRARSNGFGMSMIHASLGDIASWCPAVRRYNSGCSRLCSGKRRSKRQLHLAGIHLG